MVVLARRRPRAAAAVAALLLALVAAATVAAQRPVRGAVPAGTQVGTVTYTGLGLVTAPVTEAIRSFSWQVSSTPATTSTGGAGGKAMFGSPTVVQGVDHTSPALLAAVATGRQLPTVTVNVTHPVGTPDGIRTTRWTFTDVLLTLDRHATGAPSSSPAETVSWSYARVKQEAVTTTGAVTGVYCFNVAANAAC